MEPFTDTAFELVATHGPWVLFLMAVAETCFVTGLAVPSGVATSVATVLALQGHGSPVLVLLAAACGGAAGDSLGFWVGRRGAERLGQGRGWASRLHRRHAARAAPFFRRHPLYSVTVARLVSFVRTLMPMAAGMTPMRYRTFLVFEIPGVVAWAAMYAVIGVLARQSWARVTSMVGIGWTVVFVVAGVGLWMRTRRRRRRVARSGEGSC